MATETLSISVKLILEKFDQIQKTIDNIAAKIETASVGMDNFAKNSIEMQVQTAQQVQNTLSNVEKQQSSILQKIKTAPLWEERGG
ncbi:MAG: hypothetical protein LBU65_05490 [Planctomycetaceae bacterium]|jgi:hypothetical protein|nr:hypothetical protein [Planctomycetaceae bacterium]